MDSSPRRSRPLGAHRAGGDRARRRPVGPGGVQRPGDGATARPTSPCTAPLPGPGQTEITGDEVREPPDPLGPPAAGHRGMDSGRSPTASGPRSDPGCRGGARRSEARQEVYAELLAAATRAVQRAHSLAPQQASASVLEGIDLSKSFKGRRVVDRVTRPGAAGRDRRAARAQWSGKDHDLLPYYGAHSPGRRAGAARRARSHPRPHVPARAVGNRVSGPGALDLPENDGRGKYSGDPRDPSAWAGRSGTGSSTTCWTSSRSSTSGRARPTL